VTRPSVICQPSAKPMVALIGVQVTGSLWVLTNPLAVLLRTARLASTRTGWLQPRSENQIRRLRGARSQLVSLTSPSGRPSSGPPPIDAGGNPRNWVGPNLSKTGFALPVESKPPNGPHGPLKCMRPARAARLGKAACRATQFFR